MSYYEIKQNDQAQPLDVTRPFVCGWGISEWPLPTRREASRDTAKVSPHCHTYHSSLSPSLWPLRSGKCPKSVERKILDSWRQSIGAKMSQRVF